MNCPYCGSNVNQGEVFCKSCGAKIVSQTIQENSMDYSNINQQNNIPMSQNYTQQSQINMQQPTYNNSNYNVTSQQSQYNNSKDDELINAYIGKNVNQLRRGDFSPNTFFFGNIYVFYRKMWLLGTIWLLGSMIVTMFLSSLSGIISVAANVVISTQFKKWYLKHVEEEVDKIKRENPTTSHEQLMTICAKKGGTTIVPIIILGILYIGLLVLLILIVIGGIALFSYGTGNDFDEYITRGKIENLRATVPHTLEEDDDNTSTYKSYSITDENDYCILNMSTVNSSNYDSVSSFLEEKVGYYSSDKISDRGDKNINGYKWTFISTENSYIKTYYYATKYEDKIYNIEFNVTNDSGICSSVHTTIIDSLEFN